MTFGHEEWSRAVLAALCVFTSMTFGLTGCGAQDGNPSEPVQLESGESRGLVLSSVARRLFESSSDFQQAIAADGFIELVEYDRAALGMVACMRDHGFATAQDPIPDALLTYHLVFQYGPGQLEQGRAANQECFKEYFSEITMAWADFVAPDRARIFAEAEQATLECYRSRLSGRGVESAAIQYSNVKEALFQGDRDAGDCFEQTRAQFNLPFWGG